MNRGDAINEYRKSEQTLAGLGVKNEPLPRKYLEGLNDDEMAEELKAIQNQIKQRTEFIGTAAGEKKVESENQIDTALRSIREIVKDLSKPIAQKHLRKRRQGGKEITYIAWHDAVKYLDHYAAGWCYEIRGVGSIAGKLILTVRLSIPCLEGIIYREATGQEDESLESYGDSSSNAESMALRRASAKFGLGLHLYDQN